MKPEPFLLGILCLLSGLVNAQQEDVESILIKKGSVPFKAVAFASGDDVIASGGEDRQIYLWNANTRELIRTFAVNGKVKAISFTSDGLILAACGNEIRLLDNQGKMVRSFGGYTTDIWSFSMNEKAGRLTAGSYAKTVKVWDYATAALLLTLEGHERSTLSVCFNPSGSQIATGSLDRSVRLWDPDSGKTIRKMELHSENIFSVAYHPSGKYLASASADKSIRLWNTVSGKIIRTFTGHEGAVFDVQFSADGMHMLSCDADKTIILWETATGKKLYEFNGHTAAVNCVRFNHKGTGFASVSDDGTLRYWPLSAKYYLAGSWFEKEIEKEAAESLLFAPKKDGETRQDYQNRQLEAGKYFNNLYEKYHAKYKESLAGIPVEQLP